MTFWLARKPATATQPNHSLGTFHCNSKHGCLTCPHIDNERTNYTFYITGEVREIKQQMTCKSTNPIFIIESCKRCTKQYMGENKSTLRERFTDHRQATNNPSHAKASAAVPTHFNLPDHSIEDMTLIPLELQPTPNTSHRKVKEAHLIHRGQTLEPSGMNRQNERWQFTFISISVVYIYHYSCYFYRLNINCNCISSLFKFYSRYFSCIKYCPWRRLALQIEILPDKFCPSAVLP